MCGRARFYICFCLFFCAYPEGMRVSRFTIVCLLVLTHSTVRVYSGGVSQSAKPAAPPERELTPDEREELKRQREEEADRANLTFFLVIVSLLMLPFACCAAMVCILGVAYTCGMTIIGVRICVEHVCMFVRYVLYTWPKEKIQGLFNSIRQWRWHMGRGHRVADVSWEWTPASALHFVIAVEHPDEIRNVPAYVRYAPLRLQNIALAHVIQTGWVLADPKQYWTYANILPYDENNNGEPSAPVIDYVVRECQV
jgi:hypothetical protein